MSRVCVAAGLLLYVTVFLTLIAPRGAGGISGDGSSGAARRAAQRRAALQAAWATPKPAALSLRYPDNNKDWFPECWVAAHARIMFGEDRVLYWTPFTSDRWGNALSGYWQARALARLAGFGFDAYGAQARARANRSSVCAAAPCARPPPPARAAPPLARATSMQVSPLHVFLPRTQRRPLLTRLRPILPKPINHLPIHAVGFEGASWLAWLPKKLPPAACADPPAFAAACGGCAAEAWEHPHRCGGPWPGIRDVITDDTRRALEAWAAAEGRRLPEYGPGDVVIQVTRTRARAMGAVARLRRPARATARLFPTRLQLTTALARLPSAGAARWDACDVNSCLSPPARLAGAVREGHTPRPPRVRARARGTLARPEPREVSVGGWEGLLPSCMPSPKVGRPGASWHLPWRRARAPAGTAP